MTSLSFRSRAESLPYLRLLRGPSYLDTSPWMVLVLGLLGLVLAFYRLVLLLRHFSAERK